MTGDEPGSVDPGEVWRRRRRLLRTADQLLAGPAEIRHGPDPNDFPILSLRIRRHDPLENLQDSIAVYRKVYTDKEDAVVRLAVWHRSGDRAALRDARAWPHVEVVLGIPREPRTTIANAEAVLRDMLNSMPFDMGARGSVAIMTEWDSTIDDMRRVREYELFWSHGTRKVQHTWSTLMRDGAAACAGVERAFEILRDSMDVLDIADWSEEYVNEPGAGGPWLWDYRPPEPDSPRDE